MTLTAFRRAYPSVAAGRLLTAHNAIQAAAYELARILGHIDSDAPREAYLELGIERVESKLLSAVQALDFGDTDG